MYVYIFSLYTFYFLLLSRQVSIAVWTILMISKSPDEFIKIEMFNVGFTSKWINLIWIILFFSFFHSEDSDLYLLPYIYIYMCVCVCVCVCV